jgi:hypothetical protein
MKEPVDQSDQSKHGCSHGWLEVTRVPFHEQDAPVLSDNIPVVNATAHLCILIHARQGAELRVCWWI